MQPTSRLKLEETTKGVLLNVHAQPGAKKSRIVGLHGDRLKVAVHAVPENGKANEAILEFLAEVLGLSKNQIELVRGQTSRQKTFAISNLSVVELSSRLETILCNTEIG